jgi:hypothetical protein
MVEAPAGNPRELIGAGSPGGSDPKDLSPKGGIGGFYGELSKEEVMVS